MSVNHGKMPWNRCPAFLSGIYFDARLGLQTELYLNLAHLMASYPRQPEKLAQYMKQHLLEDHPAGPDDENEEEGGGDPEPPVEE